MAGCHGGHTVLGLAPAQAGASTLMSRLIPRGPGLRRDEKEDTGTDTQLEGPADRGGQSAKAGCNRGHTVLGLAPARAGASTLRSRLIHRGPGQRRDEKQSVGTDVLLHSMVEEVEIVL